ncbi:MAG: arginase [Hyphomicrobiales bacterium]|nr:MAG: arginase [Hyphomicrobiales bacterium]
MNSALRVDLYGVATDAGASTRGAGMGPEALRIAGFGEMLGELGREIVDHGDLRAPRGKGRQAEVLALAAETSGKALQSLSSGGMPVFLGGDHSLSMGTVSGAARHCAATGKDIHVVWIDAHADFNTPGISPSGNLHGMPLALLCGEPEFGDAFGGSWRGLVDPRNVTIFGARSIDREERRLLADRGIEVVDMREIDELGVVAHMREVLKRAEGGHLHVSFDVDSMDPSIAPGTGTPVPGGLTFREGHLIMEMLHDSDLVGSLDIVEVNPYLDRGGETARLAVALISSLFGRKIMARQADLNQKVRAEAALHPRP